MPFDCRYCLWMFLSFFVFCMYGIILLLSRLDHCFYPVSWIAYLFASMGAIVECESPVTFVAVLSIWGYLSMSKWIERINCGVVCSIPCHYPVFLLPEMSLNMKFVCQVSFKALWIEWLDVTSGEYKFQCANANKVLLIIELDLVLLLI